MGIRGATVLPLALALGRTWASSREPVADRYGASLVSPVDDDGERTAG
jgi:hypothetical protein